MPENNRLAKLAKERRISVKKLVEQVLSECGGNEFKAAMTLGVYPNTIRWHRMKRDRQAK